MESERRTVTCFCNRSSSPSPFLPIVSIHHALTLVNKNPISINTSTTRKTTRRSFSAAKERRPIVRREEEDEGWERARPVAAQWAEMARRFVTLPTAWLLPCIILQACNNPSQRDERAKERERTHRIALVTKINWRGINSSLSSIVFNLSFNPARCSYFSLSRFSLSSLVNSSSLFFFLNRCGLSSVRLAKISLFCRRMPHLTAMSSIVRMSPVKSDCHRRQ